MRTRLCITLLLALSCSACVAVSVVGAGVGLAVGVTTEVVKLPFRVGGAVVDLLDDEDEKAQDERD